MPENSRKKELLRLLEEKIWQEVVSHLPDSRMPTEEQISDPILLQNNHEWLHAYAKRDRNRLIERVRNSVIDTHSEQLLADITREPIMIFLDEIHNAIDVYPSPLSSYDEGTQEMGREYAHIFVQDWKYSFQTRVGFFRQYTTMEGSANGGDTPSGIARYNAMTRMSELEGEKKEVFLQKLCELLPCEDGSEFTWQQLENILIQVDPSNRE